MNALSLFLVWVTLSRLSASAEDSSDCWVASPLEVAWSPSPYHLDLLLVMSLSLSSMTCAFLAPHIPLPEDRLLLPAALQRWCTAVVVKWSLKASEVDGNPMLTFHPSLQCAKGLIK